MKFVPFFVIIFAIAFKLSIADISAPPPTIPRPTTTTTTTTTTTVPSPITVPANVEKIPAEIRKKLILNEEDIPFQYRNFISIDSNGSKHLLPSNEISYRVIVPTNIELMLSIYVFDYESCIFNGIELISWLGTKRLFEMILSNETYPLIFIQRTLGMELTTNFAPFKFFQTKPFAYGYVRNSTTHQINGELFSFHWRNIDMFINDYDESINWQNEPVPKFQNYNINNSTKIYFFDLNVNELGSTNCTFEFILPSYYYVAILTYDQENATSIFEEFSSTNLLGFIAGGIAVILVLIATIGGCIYLVYLGVVYCSRFNTNSLSFDSIESSIILHNKKQNLTTSKSGDGEQINFEEHLIGCFCAQCRRKKRDKEKLIHSLEPNAKKIITKYISSGLNFNAIKIQSQTEFTKLITIEMKKRNLKLKKGEIEALLQKFVNHENVKAVIEQINASKNSVIKNDNNFKV